MGFLNELLGAFSQAVSQQQQQQSGRRASGLRKVAECTPCEAQAYIDSLRPGADQKKKPRRRAKR